MPGLLSRQSAPQVVLECDSRIRQAEWHANIDVRWTLTPTNARRTKTHLGCGPIKPWDVDADAQLIVLARTRSYARWWAAVAAHVSRFLKPLGRLGDELLSTMHSTPCALVREACIEACLHVVPEHLPRDIG